MNPHLDTLIAGLPELIRKAPQGEDIWMETVELARTLLIKNIDYGDSALNPMRVFATADTIEQLRVRIDDKLSRIHTTRNNPIIREDTTGDLIGYLILLRIAERGKTSE